MINLLPEQHAFGQSFQYWADNQLDLLPGYGWTDGGCLTLAYALDAWSAGRLHPRVFAFKDRQTGDWIPSHYCVQLPESEGSEAHTGMLLLDGDGVWLDKTLLGAMNRHGNTSNVAPTLLMEHQEGIRLYHAAILDGAGEINPHSDAAFELMNRLQREFGAFDPQMVCSDASQKCSMSNRMR